MACTQMHLSSLFHYGFQKEGVNWRGPMDLNGVQTWAHTVLFQLQWRQRASRYKRLNLSTSKVFGALVTRFLLSLRPIEVKLEPSSFTGSLIGAAAVNRTGSLQAQLFIECWSEEDLCYSWAAEAQAVVSANGWAFTNEMRGPIWWTVVKEAGLKSTAFNPHNKQQVLPKCNTAEDNNGTYKRRMHFHMSAASKVCAFIHVHTSTPVWILTQFISLTTWKGSSISKTYKYVPHTRF